MAWTKIVIVFGIFAVANAQRSPYAGSRPQSGYKDRFTPGNNAIGANANDPLANRFGSVDGTTQRLPHDAYGDAHAVNYLNSLPVDQRPFWLVNYQAIEAIRNTSGGPAPVNTLGNRFGVNDVNRVSSSPNNIVVAEPGFIGLMPVPQNNFQSLQSQQTFLPQGIQQSFIPQGSVVAGNPLNSRSSFASNQGVAGTQLTLGAPTGSRGHFQG